MAEHTWAEQQQCAQERDEGLREGSSWGVWGAEDMKRDLSVLLITEEFAYCQDAVSCGSSNCSYSTFRGMAYNSKSAVHTKMVNSQLGEG